MSLGSAITSHNELEHTVLPSPLSLSPAVAVSTVMTRPHPFSAYPSVGLIS